MQRSFSLFVFGAVVLGLAPFASCAGDPAIPAGVPAGSSTAPTAHANPPAPPPISPAALNDAPAKAVVGRSGGAVTTAAGVGVTIPDGALRADATVTVTPSPPSAGPVGSTLVGAQYDFGPEGTTFAKPVSLKVAFDPAKLPAGTAASSIKIYTKDPSSGEFEWLPTTVVDSTHVSAMARHFSPYGPATKPKPDPVAKGSNDNVGKDPYEPVVPQIPDDGTFCTQFKMSTNFVPHEKSRLGRVKYDENCSKYEFLCTSSPPLVVSKKPTGCVEVEVIGGTSGQPVADPANNQLQCIECPKGGQDQLLLPNMGQALCAGPEVELAKKGDAVIFNINGYDVDATKKIFDAAAQAYEKVFADMDTCIKNCSGSGAKACQYDCTTDASLRDWEFSPKLSRVLRTIALELNFCGEGPWGLPSPNGTWKYDDSGHRAELNNLLIGFDLGNANFVAAASTPRCDASHPCADGATCQSGVCKPAVCADQGLTSQVSKSCSNSSKSSSGGSASQCVDGSPLAEITPNAAAGTTKAGLKAYISAFTARACSPFVYSLDDLALGLIHEMRHMGTPNWGGGDTDPNVSTAAMATEHHLNELEDYEEMFKHPYLIGVPASVKQRLADAYDVGRDLEYQCMQGTWGSKGAGSGGAAGYPPDTGAGASNPLGIGALPMGMSPAGFGMGGLMIPGGMGLGFSPRRPAMPFALMPSCKVNNCLINNVQISTCTETDGTVRQYPKPVTEDDRCTIAKWARNNRWMASKMVRSMSPRADNPKEWNGQPWNTLANYVYALPFRQQLYKACVGSK